MHLVHDVEERPHFVRPLERKLKELGFEAPAHHVRKSARNWCARTPRDRRAPARPSPKEDAPEAPGIDGDAGCEFLACQVREDAVRHPDHAGARAVVEPEQRNQLHLQLAGDVQLLGRVEIAGERIAVLLARREAQQRAVRPEIIARVVCEALHEASIPPPCFAARRPLWSAPCGQRFVPRCAPTVSDNRVAGYAAGVESGNPRGSDGRAALRMT